MIPPILVRKLGFAVLGKLFRRFGGAALLKYKPALIGMVGIALVAAGGYVWHKLRSVDAYKSSIAELTQALDDQRAHTLRLFKAHRRSLAVIELRERRIDELETHARELVARLREIPTDACIDTAAPAAALDLLRE